MFTKTLFFSLFISTISFACIDDFKAFISRDDFTTDSVIVSKNGKIIFEEYYNGYRQDMRHRAWSMTKSFNAFITLIAHQDKIIDIYSPISNYISVPERFKNITLMNLLQMTSGIKWNEGYEAGPFNSNVVEMLFLPNGLKNMPEYVLKHEKIANPGDRYYYSSGDTLVTNAVLKRVLNEKYVQFPFEKFYQKIGADSVSLEQDNSGHYVASSYMYATPRDFHKVASIFLNRGAGILEDALFQKLIELNYKNKMEYYNNAYGAGFWLNQPVANKKTPYPSAPDDIFMALGHNGQIMAMFPTEKIIMLRLASEKSGQKFDRDQFLGFYKCFQKL